MNNANNTDILQQSFWMALDLAAIDEQTKADAKTTLTSISTLIAQHADTKYAVRGNPDLSENGRISQLAALVTRSDATLAKLTRDTVATLESRTVELSQSLANAAGITPTVIDVMLMIERRTAAANLDPLVVQTKLIQLAQSGADDLSVLAILGASTLAPLVTLEVAARATAYMGARKLPDAAEQLRQARELLAILNNAIATATREFATNIERAMFGVDAVTQLARA